MAVQPRGKAQSQYGWFTADRNALPTVERPPVEGTVPMGDAFQPYRFDPGESAEDAAQKAGEKLENPLEPTMAVLERGEKLFNTFCIVCHGERAEGDGPVVGPDWFPAPPSLLTKGALAYPDGRIYHVITKGQNKMPSYADSLEPDERWAVVLYVRALQRAKEMAAEQAAREGEDR